MMTMVARIVAGLLVLVLVGPSVAAATCELTCAIASHHRSAPSPPEALCHEHQTPIQGNTVSTNLSALCHESGELPSAIVDTWLNTAVIATLPAAFTVIARPPAPRSALRAPGRSALLNPHPAHRPIRV
jgi:hypothetical protein